MKKSLMIIAFLFTALVAKAQFEKGTWLLNPSVTGLDLSYSSAEKTQFGFQVQGGAFLEDNIALLVHIGADWTDPIDVYSLGVGGRYYFDRTGVYMGAGLKMKKWDLKGGVEEDDYTFGVEAGYAYFLSKTVTIEPAVYYDMSFKDGDYSKIGLKIGFGFYF